MLNKRILSLLLAIVLVVGLMPTSVFATETEGTTAPTESVPETTGEAIEPQNEEDPTACDICKVADCGVEHKYCEKCEKYDCGKPHVICEVCKVEDCGVEHEQCDLCGAYDCNDEHEYCTICKIWNCDQVHNIPCMICGKTDCGETHVKCETCGSYSCTGHENAEEKPGASEEKPDESPMESEEEEHSLAEKLLEMNDLVELVEELCKEENEDAYLNLSEKEIIEICDHVNALYDALEDPSEEEATAKDDTIFLLSLLDNAPEGLIAPEKEMEVPGTYAGVVTLLYSTNGRFYVAGNGWEDTGYTTLRQIEMAYNRPEYYSQVNIWFQKTFEFAGVNNGNNLVDDYTTTLGHAGVHFVLRRLFTGGPIIKVNGNLDSFLQLQNVWIFNDYKADTASTGTPYDGSALEVHGTTGLLMLNGAYIRSCENTYDVTGTAVLLENGGNVELYGVNGKTNIARFNIAIDQEYGKTRLKSAGSNGYEFTENKIDVLLNRNHGNRYSGISLWTNDYFPTIKVTLDNVEEWVNEDVVFDSGYEWVGADLVRTPLSPDDISKITVVNQQGMTQQLKLHYWNPPAGQPEDYDQAMEYNPYIRFTNDTVYNEQTTRWYPTLYEAIADRYTESGHTLVFYGNTNEPQTIDLGALGKNNLVIKSAPGQNYTATWGASGTTTPSSTGCFIVPSGYTVQLGHTNDYQNVNGTNVFYGTLTFNGNNKSRVVAIGSGGTVDMPGHMTITGGNAGTDNGGGIYISDGAVLNLSGGSFSGNTAGKGYAIYQNGTLNLSGTPTFASGQDVYLPNTRTDDSNAADKVITKAGPFDTNLGVPVTLGDGDANQYKGRNYVVSGTGTVTAGDLNCFKILNLVSPYVGRYNATDKHASNKPVLELGYPTGTLSLKKTVSGDELPTNAQFTFELTLPYYPDGDAYQISGVDTGAVTVSNGNMTVTLTANQTVTIGNVPAGSYSIVETGALNNYTTTWTGATVDASNLLKVSGTIEKDMTDIVTCNNEYTTPTGNLKIKKTGVNETKDGKAPFVFQITGNDISMKVVIYGNGEATVVDLPAGKYKVEEISGYWRYDLAPAQSNIEVGGGNTTEVTFNNERTKDNWLDDWAKATNKFNGSAAILDSGAAD